MSTQLWAVFHGEYDERELYGIFSSRALADSFLEDLNSRVIQGAVHWDWNEPQEGQWRVSIIKSVTASIVCLLVLINTKLPSKS